MRVNANIFQMVERKNKKEYKELFLFGINFKNVYIHVIWNREENQLH